MIIEIFSIFVLATFFFLLVGWLSRNQVAMFFAGLLFIFTGLGLMTGVQYNCGFVENKTGNVTYFYNASNINYTFVNTTIQNAITYCTWKFNTDASNGFTLNTGASILFMFLGIFLLFNMYLIQRKPADL